MQAPVPGMIIGVDLGGTTLAGGLVDAAGVVRHSRTAATDRRGRGDGMLDNLLEMILSLAEAARRLRLAIRGVGVPGVVEVEAGTIGEDIQGIPEFPGMALGRILRWARFYAFEGAFDRTRIVRSTLDKESGILGAAALFLYERGCGRLD